MDYQPLFRQLRLSLLSDQDVSYALDILEGRATVSQVAETLGQDEFSFDGDGDILVLSYTRDNDPNEIAAVKALGDRGDRVVRKYLFQAVKESKAPIELVLRSCNLSAESIVLLAAAFTANVSFVGFSISGNPMTDAARKALKRACIETHAPIKWFQGKVIPNSLLERRLAFTREKMMSTLEDTRLSPRTKAEHLRQLSESATESSESTSTRRKSSTSSCEENERLKWRDATMTKLRAVHPEYSEEDLSDLVANLELHSLQRTIDRLLFETMKENDNPAYVRTSSFTFGSSNTDPIA